MREQGDYRELLDTLQQLEVLLRELDWWSATPPEPRALASTMPFCADTLHYQQWLQWVFIPRIRALLEGNHPLPGQSGLAPMGEMAWLEQPDQAALLLPLLRRIDRLLNETDSS